MLSAVPSLHERLRRSLPALLLASLLGAAPALHGAGRAGTLVADDTFAPQLVDPGGGRVEAAVLRADGRAVIGGRFAFVGETGHRYLAGLRPNGSLDPGFAADGGPDGVVTHLLGLPDGKIIVAGRFAHFGGQPAARLARLTTDGKLDPDFASPRAIDGAITALALHPDGHLDVGGTFSTFNGRRVPGLVRLDPDGRVDPGFHPDLDGAGAPAAVRSLALAADGTLLVVHAPSRATFEPMNPLGLPSASEATAAVRVSRLRPDGGSDPDFHVQPNASLVPARVFALARGRFLLAGSGGLLRYERDGGIDGGFRFAWQGRMEVAAVAELDDGRLVVGGDTAGQGLLPARLLLLDASGAERNKYIMPRDELHAFTTIAVAPNQRLLAAGRVSPAADRLAFSNSSNRVLVFDDQLREDRAFRARVGGIGRVTAAVVHPDGAVTVGGVFRSGEALSGTGITRLLPTGAPDPHFHSVGSLDGIPGVLVPLVDNGFLAAGITSENLAVTSTRPVLRFRGDGEPDPTFATDLPLGGVFTDYAILRDGSTVLVGDLEGRISRRQHFSNVVRIDASGRVDRELARTSNTWLGGGAGRILSAAGTASGHLLVAGEFTLIQGQERSCLARIGAGGLVDAAFVPDTGEFAVIDRVSVLGDQSIFVDGWARDPGGGATLVRRFARLRPDGRRDPALAMPAWEADGQPLLATVLTDGTIAAVVHQAPAEGPARLVIVHLDHNARRLPDAPITLNDSVTELELVPAGGGVLYLAGEVRELDGRPRYGLARLVVRR